MADAYKNLQAVIALASGEGEAFVTAFEGVREIANSTFTSLSQTADLFRKVTEATRVMGTTQSEVLDITRTVNQAVQLSGASAGGAAGAILQFNQALSSGRLSGQEFNSVSEQAPRLLKVFTDALGISIGELRKLAFSQKLTTDILLESLESQADKVNAEFATLPLTVGRSLTTLKNQLIDFIGEADAANKVTERIAKAIIFLSENLDAVAATLKAVVTAAIAYKLVGLAASMFAKANAATAAAAALRAEAAAKNGLAAANTAATATSATLNRTLGGTTQNLAAAGQSAVAFGARMIGAFSFLAIGYLAISLLKQLGEGIASLAARATGLSKAFEDSEKAVKRSEEWLASVREAHKKAAASALLFQERMVGLGKESAAVVTRFDDLIKSGKNVSQALVDLQKELDLSDLTGIDNAVSALNALAIQGKVSADQV
ncbi:MAG: tape measure protein, partial [Pseudomonadota bacterium]|nr:tape measure protein [Pseudomonadota bacterium]